MRVHHCACSQVAASDAPSRAIESPSSDHRFVGRTCRFPDAAWVLDGPSLDPIV